MPKFYFHLYNELDVPDLEGIELPDLGSARASAVTQGLEVAAALLKDTGTVDMRHRIEIEDERHMVLDTVAWRDIIRVEG